MPVWELFEEQTQEYRDSVLPPSVTARVSVEAGSTFGWEKWVGQKGESVGINEFGASAPGPLLYEKYGECAEVAQRKPEQAGVPPSQCQPAARRPTRLTRAAPSQLPPARRHHRGRRGGGC